MFLKICAALHSPVSSGSQITHFKPTVVLLPFWLFIWTEIWYSDNLTQKNIESEVEIGMWPTRVYPQGPNLGSEGSNRVGTRSSLIEAV